MNTTAPQTEVGAGVMEPQETETVGVEESTETVTTHDETTTDLVEPEPVTEDTSDSTPEPAQDDEHGVSKARREAAGYRTKLRAAETANASLRDQVIGIHLKESHGVTIKALEAAGIDLNTLVGQDGMVSVEAVSEAAETARTTLGIPNTRFSGTADQGYRGPVPSTATWNGLIKTITRG